MHALPTALTGLALTLAALTVTGCATTSPPPARAAADIQPSECVVLLHGLARTSDSMEDLANTLISAGYSVANIDYESRSVRIEELAEPTVDEGLSMCRTNGATAIHVVTHSLGGILLRYYLTQQPIPELGRTVMLAPPNQGSEAVDRFRNVWGIGWIFGVAGFQLGTDPDSLPRQLGAVNFDLGVIAANRSIDPITSMALPNPDDGKVSVASTRVAGMNDFVVVPHTHALMMKAEIVQQQIVYYLENGHFDHSGDALPQL